MGIVDTVRDIASLVQKADNIELNQKILELQAQLGELLEDQRALRDTVRTLREELELQEELQFDDNLYWIGEGEAREGPFCTKCWDVDKNLVRLQKLDGQDLYCPACESSPPGHWTPTIA